jgi:hypothetical protein
LWLELLESSGLPSICTVNETGPICSRSPGFSSSSVTRLPLTNVPLELFRSFTFTLSSRHAQFAVLPRDIQRRDAHVAIRPAANHQAFPCQRQLTPLPAPESDQNYFHTNFSRQERKYRF